jgi:hypothetical protein
VKAIPALLALLALAFTREASAQESNATNAPSDAFGAPAGEIALASVSALSLTTYLLPQRTSDWGPDRARPSVRERDAESDVMGGAGALVWLMPFTYMLEAAHLDAAGADEPFGRALRLPMMQAEALGLAVGATYALKRSFGRCRPRAWSDGRCAGGEYDGFPSGHTVTVSALAGVSLSLLARSEGRVGARATGFALTELAALSAAALRVLSGAHSTEDVAAGWLLGHGAGLAVGFAHPMERVQPVGPAPSLGAVPTTFTIDGRF